MNFEDSVLISPALFLGKTTGVGKLERKNLLASQANVCTDQSLNALRLTLLTNLRLYGRLMSAFKKNIGFIFTAILFLRLFDRLSFGR